MDMSNIVFDNITVWDSNGGLSIQQRSAGNIRNVTWSNIRPVESRLATEDLDVLEDTDGSSGEGRGGGTRRNPPTSSRCGSLLPPASADVRSSDDVTAFESVLRRAIKLRDGGATASGFRLATTRATSQPSAQSAACASLTFLVAARTAVCSRASRAASTTSRLRIST